MERRHMWHQALCGENQLIISVSAINLFVVHAMCLYVENGEKFMCVFHMD